MNIVLITAGIDDFSSRFHQFPAKPVAIIELDDWTLSQQVKVRARWFLSKFVPDRFSTLETYCKQHDLTYLPISRHQKHKISPALARCAADLVITYRCPIVPVKYLQSLSYGAINLHASLLPAFRGGDPLFWQVLHGVGQTGVTVHRLTDQMDAGPILRQVRIDRPRFVSEKSLWKLLNIEHGYDAVSQTIQDLKKGKSDAMQQHDLADATPAPNGARGRWRELAAQMSLDDDAIRDIACFLGESESDTQ